MSEDYFDDASDADFLALAQQIDPGRNSISNVSSRPSATTSAARPPQKTAGGTSSTNTVAQRPETPKTNSAQKLLRPGFNAIIVNTRQVLLRADSI